MSMCTAIVSICAYKGAYMYVPYAVDTYFEAHAVRLLSFPPAARSFFFFYQPGVNRLQVRTPWPQANTNVVQLVQQCSPEIFHPHTNDKNLLLVKRPFSVGALRMEVECERVFSKNNAYETLSQKTGTAHQTLRTAYSGRYSPQKEVLDLLSTPRETLIVLADRWGLLGRWSRPTCSSSN